MNRELVIRSPKRKRCRRSFKLPAQKQKASYFSGKRVGPTNLSIPANDEREFLLADQELRNLIWVLSRKNSIIHNIPSWTGFNIQIRNGILVVKSSIRYLDSIDLPATEISTVYEILDKCLKIKEKLNLAVLVCVFDQAIFAKAVEIKWKHPEKYENCIIMLGIFHMLMMFLGIIGKRFKDGGLRDVLVQSGVIAEGSVEKTLSGKMYNRAVRYCKIVYEALYRILIDLMEENANTIEERIAIDEMNDIISDFNNDVCQVAFGEVFEHDILHRYHTLVNNFKEGLSTDQDNLASFWLSFMEMVDILLNTIYATRTGDWCLLLECIRDISEYAFAYDNHNYARYLTPFLAEMLSLEETFPGIYKEFMNGNFVAQLSEANPFGKIEPDKCIEMTVNRDTKTAGGTTGFSRSNDAVNRWTLNGPYRAGMKRSLHEFLSMHKRSFGHSDLTPGRIKRDERDVESVMKTFNDIFINPFEDSPLLCISNGMLASIDVCEDLTNAKDIGKTKMKQFAEDRMSEGGKSSLFEPIKKLKLKTFSSMIKKRDATANKKTIPMKATKDLFGQIALIMRKRDLDLKQVFCYPLGPIPWALAGVMGELKKTNKASILHELEKATTPLERPPSNNVTIINGMAVLQKARANGLTFGQLAQTILGNVLSSAVNASRIDVVFYVYISNSIKSAERLNRSAGGTIAFRSLQPEHPIKQWNHFLSYGGNKTEVIAFLVAEWGKSERLLNRELGTFFVTTKDQCYEISNNGVRVVPELVSTQEEADTRMMLHVSHAKQQGFTKFVIQTPDTDVFMIALSLLQEIGNSIFIKTGVKKRSEL